MKVNVRVLSQTAQDFRRLRIEDPYGSEPLVADCYEVRAVTWVEQEQWGETSETGEQPEDHFPLGLFNPRFSSLVSPPMLLGKPEDAPLPVPVVFCPEAARVLSSESQPGNAFAGCLESR